MPDSVRGKRQKKATAIRWRCKAFFMTDAMDKLVRNWKIGQIQTLSPILSGTSSRTYSLQTSQGQYILRSVASRDQAERECAILRRLSGEGISAELVSAICEAGYIPYEGRYYSLQTCLPGKMPDLSKERQICSAAQTIGSFHKAMEALPQRRPDDDRFSAISLLQKAGTYSFPRGLFPETTGTVSQRREFLQSLEAQLSTDHCIHADLGPWNLLWDGVTIRIIDFGESRPGDIHFDLAAVVCGILSKCGDRESFLRRLALLRSTYEESAGPVDTGRLQAAVSLWLLRGALAAACMQDQTAGERACCRFAREILRWKSYTEREKI